MTRPIKSDIVFVCECSPLIKNVGTVRESMRALVEECVIDLPAGCRVGVLNYGNTPGEKIVWADSPAHFDKSAMFAADAGMPNLYHALDRLPALLSAGRHIVVVLTYCGPADTHTLLSDAATSFLRKQCEGVVVYGTDRMACNMAGFPVDSNATFFAGKAVDSDRFRFSLKSLVSAAADTLPPEETSGPADAEDDNPSPDDPIISGTTPDDPFY